MPVSRAASTRIPRVPCSLPSLRCSCEPGQFCCQGLNPEPACWLRTAPGNSLIPTSAQQEGFRQRLVFLPPAQHPNANLLPAKPWHLPPSRPAHARYRVGVPAASGSPFVLAAAGRSRRRTPAQVTHPLSCRTEALQSSLPFSRPFPWGRGGSRLETTHHRVTAGFCHDLPGHVLSTRTTRVSSPAVNRRLRRNGSELRLLEGS